MIGKMITCRSAIMYEGMLTSKKQYKVLDIDKEKNCVKLLCDNGRTRLFSTYCFEFEGVSVGTLISGKYGNSISGKYTIWIEAEERAEGEWDINNDNTDVIVTFENGSRWVASFFTYSNIEKLTQNNKKTGECMNGKYFWSSDMILIDEVSRKCIEEVVKYLIAEGKFENIFRQCTSEIEETDK